MAVYVMPVNAVVEIQIVGRLHGQTTRTTFHYRYSGIASSPDGATAIGDFLDNFDVQVGAKIRGLASNEWMHEYTTGQMINPTRYRAVFDDIGQNGVVVSNSCPSGTAVVISRQGLIADRKWNGRIYLPAVPTSIEDNSMIDGGAQGNYDPLLASMLVVLQGSVPAEQFTPIVGPKNPATALDDVLTTRLDPILRYQRRREIGVGE